MADINYIPYAQRAAEIERQRRYAELMQQQAADPLQSQMVGGRVVPISPWLGLAKMLQAGLGGYAERKATEAEKELKKQGQEEAGKYFQNLVDYSQGKEVTGQTPQMAAVKGFGPEELPVLNVQDGKFSQAMQNTYATPTKAGMLAKMMEGMRSENPDIAKYASAFGTALMPKEASLEMGTIDPSKFTPASIKAAMQSNDPSLLEPVTEAKSPSYQRQTKEWSDKSGNKYKQDYAWNSATATMEPVGEAYLADVYHAPGTSKDDDTKAGATLRTEFNNHPVVKNHAIVSSAYDNLLNNEETGAGDMTLIYQYIKMLDPTTGVKEGEYASAADTAGIPSLIRNLYNKAVDGEKLQPEQRQSFISQAGKIYETSKRQYDTVKTGIEQIGKDTGVNPRLYTLPEPKRRSKGTEELPPGFVVEPPASQSTFGSPQNSIMFQSPNRRAF